MKIGVVCGPLLLKDDFPALCAWLAENGFQSVDMRSVDPEEKATIESAGLEVGTFSAPSLGRALDADEAKRAEAVAALTSEIGQAGEMGLKTLFACLVPPDPLAARAQTFEIWKTFWPQVVSACESAGIRIAMEPWPGPAPAYPTIGCTPEMWRAMFDVCPSPAFGLCYDPSHMARLGIDYLRVLREFGGRVHHVHGKDTAISAEDLYLQGRLPQTFGKPAFKCSEGWWRYCIPGDGVVDWRAIAVELTALDKTDLCFSIELEDGCYMNDEAGNKAGLLAAKAYLQSVLR